ncbi:MAG: histidinol dehydrogenase [Terriglobia bacterium]|nr:histidinol dehydrogenase [Terriglobia bacterium]
MRVLERQKALDYAARNLIDRGAERDPKLERTVERIVRDVREGGERKLRAYAEKFDGLGKKQPLRVSEEELQGALDSVSPDFITALERAAANIRRFAEWQKPESWLREIEPGLKVGQSVVPIDSVGCYVPGGRYPLPSSLLMTVIPAQIAGVPHIQVASPRPAPQTLAAAALLGIKHFYRIGGAQAIAAFAYGLAGKDEDPVIPRVKKIVGPGNSYVTAAKKLVAFDCAIDMLAGPTEAIVLAHEGDPNFYAADLVAQAEHDPDTLVVFITSNRKLAKQVANACGEMSKKNLVARESLRRNAVTLVIPDREEALGWANAIAPEHITVPEADAKFVFNAGSVFVGQYSPQSLGDYASGPNHTLPTGGAARYRGGLSVLDYLKIITVQEVSKAALKKIAPTVTLLAEAEGLKAHAESVRVRL